MKSKDVKIYIKTYFKLIFKENYFILSKINFTNLLLNPNVIRWVLF